MSELKDILTESQLVKHYQVLQYLSNHPNEAFTLAQLDYLLPRGAALQRFPEDWVQAMRNGMGSSRSVELVEKTDDEGLPLPSGAATASTELGPAAAYFAQRATRVLLVCRRPKVHTLEALSVVLQSPSTQLDAEACVAVHTDQIDLSEALLRDAQRAGLAYYFPDNYSRDELRARVLGAAGGAGGGSQRGPDGTSDSLELLSETCVYPALPPGLHLHHDLFSIRGLRTRDDHCIPVHLHVGEVLFLVMDNANAVEKHLGRQHEVPFLKLEHDLRVAGASVAANAGDAPVLIDVKQRAFNAPCTASPTGTVRATKVVLRLTAVRAAASMKLVLSFPNYLVSTGSALAPCVVNMQVIDDPVEMPGVLIGRDRHPISFSLPERVLLKDALVNPTPLATAGHAEPDDSADDALSPVGVKAVPARLASLPLPWWENSSPLISGVRDATYPSEAQVKSAVERVFSANALSAVARQQVARLNLQQSRDAVARRKRTRSRAHLNLTNRHLTHFGLDTSVPCLPDGRS